MMLKKLKNASEDIGTAMSGIEIKDIEEKYAERGW